MVLWVWVIAFVLGSLVSATGRASYASAITYALVFVRVGYTVLLLLIDLATLPRQVARANAPAEPTPGKRRWNVIGTMFIAIEMAVVLIANIFFSWLGPAPTAP